MNCRQIGDGESGSGAARAPVLPWLRRRDDREYDDDAGSDDEA
jgi:hypothetical protein